MAVGNLVKGLLIVKEDDVNLRCVVQSFGKVVYRQEELSLGRPALSKPMLSVGQDVVLIKVFDNSTMDHMLAELTEHRC